MKNPRDIVATLLETDPKDFVEQSWSLDLNDLRAALAAEKFKVLRVDVLSRNNRWEGTDMVEIHVYIGGDPNRSLPSDRQVRIKEIVRAWCEAVHAPVISQYWIATVITQSVKTYHLDTQVMVDSATKIINQDN